MHLKTPLEKAGPKYRFYASRLKKLNILTLEDLLTHLPSNYVDRSITVNIEDLTDGEDITITGTISNIKNTFTRRRGFTVQTAKVTDDSGSITCTWFNQPYITRALTENTQVSITGDVTGGKKFLVKEFETLASVGASIHTGRLVPKYPATKNVSVKWLRGRIAELLPQAIEVDILIPDKVKDVCNLPDKSLVLKKIHFPENMDEVEQARRYFAFEELFLLQLSSEIQKEEWKRENHAIPIKLKNRNEVDKIIKSLPFTLTTAQQNAVEEILLDLAQKTSMNRLLQGDVGSGKTVVAAIAMYVAHACGFQSALMAPTEILAHQHFETISNLLAPHGVKVALATSSKKLNIPDPKSKTRDPFDIIVGTHALLNKSITFKNLGLITIDEQQRFGVEQRGLLREKGSTPHFLTMTATPIPRTVFLAMYGELSFSYLDTLPKGRKKIKTWVVPPEKREKGYEWIAKHIYEGAKTGKSNQIFIICPFIDESETLTTVKAAKVEFEKLSSGPFKNFRVAMLHGRMKSKEKEETLSDFRNHKYDILVTTPVVEVGIDIPDATIMLIEGADRFGLAQLHQLRGRVGRNEHESYCLLLTDDQGERKIERLKILETKHLGADLAEADLKLRGPGEMYGTRQSGKNSFQIARITDTDILEMAQKAARDIAPSISKHPILHDRLKASIIRKISRD